MIAANDLYHVVPIEGKGFGCVALKDIKVGTLIIEEIPQFPPAKKETGDLVGILFSLMECFNSMSETDKGEFLELSNQFKDDLEFTELMHQETAKYKNKHKNQKNEEVLEKAIEVYGIYKTNSFPNGVLLKSSRFNHSCASNAELVWRKEEKEGSEIRAVSKIKAGDEVTINFDILNIGLRRISERQEILMDRWGFDCHCSLCEEERINSNDEKYDYFEKCKREAVELCLSRTGTNNNNKVTHTKLHREIFCYKEMYKFAKEKRASRQFLHRFICVEGWDTAYRGYDTVTQYAKKIQDKAKKGKALTEKEKYEIFQFTKQAEEFKKECEQFGKIGELMTKVVFSEDSVPYRQWQERNKAFSGHDKKMEQFRTQFGTIKV